MPLSGQEMLKLYKRAGWSVNRQTGSHIRVQKYNNYETIPNHKELKKGMEKYLLKRLREASL